MKKRLSVVIPIYNSQNYIKETLNSILIQINQDIDEIIVIDDCSTDFSFEIVSQYKSLYKSIILLRTTSNSGGPATPRNIGIKKARGIYIAFCDSDDIWHPSKLAIQIPFLDRYDFVCSSSLPFRKRIPNAMTINNFSILELKKIHFYAGNPIANSSVICRRNIFKKLLFNDSIKLVAVEDFDLWLKILLSNIVILKINTALLFYRKSENQISANKLIMAKKNLLVYVQNFGIYKGIFFHILYLLSSFSKLVRFNHR